MTMPGIIATATPWYTSIVAIDPVTIVATLVNTLLIVLMYRFFVHKKITAILEKRRELINKETADATKAKESALASEKEYLKKLTETKNEARQIVSEAVVKAQERESEIIRAAKEEAGRIRDKATEEIEREKKRAINEIKNQISELVIMAAQKVAEKEINKADNEKLIENFIVKIK
ncbi:MAG: F0F1 ATP synthase subunit B [Oscillospiraceae bacterium]|nr:F0F1 ATP synthase subunit B [Oscillospiraceae bacterium]